MISSVAGFVRFMITAPLASVGKGHAGDQQAAVKRQRFMTAAPPASVGKGRAGDQQAAVKRQRFMTTEPPASVARAALATSRRLIAPSSAQ